MKIELLSDKKIVVFPFFLVILFLLLVVIDSVTVPKIERLNCGVRDYLDSMSYYEENLTKQLESSNESIQKEINLKLDRLFYDKLDFIKKKKTETDKELGWLVFISDNFDWFTAVHFVWAKLDPFFLQPCMTATISTTSCIVYSDEECVKELIGIETKKLSGMNLLINFIYLSVLGYIVSFIYFYCFDVYKESKKKIKTKRGKKK